MKQLILAIFLLFSIEGYSQSRNYKKQFPSSISEGTSYSSSLDTSKTHYKQFNHSSKGGAAINTKRVKRNYKRQFGN